MDPGNGSVDELCEYDTLVARIRPLAMNGVAHLPQRDVQAFARRADVDPKQLATLIAANRLEEETALPDWFFYALGRRGVRLDLAVMLLLGDQELRNAVNAAVEAGIVVSPSGDDVIDSLLNRLQAVLVRKAFDEPPEHARISIGALLGTSLVEKELQESFLAKYLSRSASPEEFWKSLEKDERFSREAIDDLRFTLQLAWLMCYRLPVLEQFKQLRRSGEVGSLQDLGHLDRTRWSEILDSAAEEDAWVLPETIPGDTPEERLDHYITSLRASIEQLFPSDSLRKALTAVSDGEPNLARFMCNTEDLNEYWENIDAFLRPMKR